MQSLAERRDYVITLNGKISLQTADTCDCVLNEIGQWLICPMCFTVYVDCQEQRNWRKWVHKRVRDLRAQPRLPEA